MVAIPQQIFSGDTIVTVMVELPEAAVKDVKMFIREVLSDLVNVFLFINGMKGIEEIRASNLSGCNFSVVASIHNIKNSGYDGDSILLLKFCMVREEVKARVIIQELLHVRMKVFLKYISPLGSLDQTKKTFVPIKRSHLVVPEPLEVAQRHHLLPLFLCHGIQRPYPTKQRGVEERWKSAEVFRYLHKMTKRKRSPADVPPVERLRGVTFASIGSYFRGADTERVADGRESRGKGLCRAKGAVRGQRGEFEYDGGIGSWADGGAIGRIQGTVWIDLFRRWGVEFGVLLCRLFPRYWCERRRGWR
mmetsp:Transcript_42698/g.83937  ORF Transcript_42698/g.83937 Transcript_42698/m.83937 type:complete len:305 (-) Transcript_42698:296-1210(-)